MELGETPNMTRVGDDSKFLDWARKFKLDIGSRSWGLWKGAQVLANMDPSVGLNWGP